MRRTVWSVAVAVTLLVLLAVLATLQYQWLGEVSNAERERLRASLRTRASDFSLAFDREITRLYLTFQPEADALDGDPAGTLSEAYARVASESPGGNLVKAVYLLEFRGPRAGVLQQLDPATRTLTPTDWPAPFQSWWSRVESHLPARGVLAPMLLSDAIDARAPALVVPLPALRRIPTSDGHFMFGPDPDGAARGIIVWLDAARLRQRVATLVDRHFGSAEASEYYVRVVTRDEPVETVYASGGADVTPRNADIAMGLFDLRLDDLDSVNAMIPSRNGPTGPVAVKDRVAITIVRRPNGPDRARVLMTGGDRQSAWQVLVRGKSGSLEALVAQSRRRNLAIGLGVLGLLAASFVFIIGSAQRQRRLAEQQLEFVAAVSHELRTPLAVIRSAGENLADGVVADGDQVRRYGALIGTEGRRLSEMVERVLVFAGIRAAMPVRVHADVDMVKIVADAVAAVAGDARDRDVQIAVASSPLPPVAGDPAALQSAVQNIVSNAVKYSAAGKRVDVSIDSRGDQIELRVKDEGIGIDGVDLPHIFKPFFRGRRAVDAQIRGTGVGLSVVRHIVDAHGGRIAVESRVREGTTVVVTLRVARREHAAATSESADGTSEARATT